jgi:o-succinylbenzoate synthase
MIDIESFRVMLTEPIQTARGSIQDREGFLVSVKHDGHYGVGEATPLPGWTESYEECEAALVRARDIADELDWGMALAKLDVPAARHGISLAFAEARSRRANEPLYRSLGREDVVETVAVNATLGANDSPDDTARDATRALERGFETLKLKVGANGIEEDIERTRAVRNAVGDDIAIRVDANGAWTLDQARRAIAALDALDVEYVEQPLPTADLSAHADLRGAVDIALDESLVAYDVDAILEADAADVIVLKPMVLGGPDKTVEAAQQVQDAGLDVVVSNTIDAVVARTGAAHIAASIPDVRACGLATGDLLDTDLGPDPAPVQNGKITVPQDPGLGLPERP